MWWRSPFALPIGTPEHIRWLRGTVAVVLLLNLFDTMLTVYWVEAGLAVEANPLMAMILGQSPVLFAVAKALLVGGGCFLLWQNRSHHWAVVAIFIAFVAYYGVAVQHVDGVTWAALRALETLIG